MSQENVEAYKRAVEAANCRDLEAMLEEFDPEVEWYPRVVGLGSDVYRGADGIRELFGDIERPYFAPSWIVRKPSKPPGCRSRA